MISITARNTPRLPDWHLNKRWTISDMDKIERKARNRATLPEIAEYVGASVKEVSEVMARNGIELRK